MSWWSPDSWWHDVKGDVSKIPGPIKSLIKTAVDGAIKTVEKVVDAGLKAQEEAIGALVTELHPVFSAVGRLGDDINSITGHVIPAAFDAAKHYTDEAADTVGHAVTAAVRQEVHDVATLGHDIVEAKDWVTTNVYDPIKTWMGAEADRVGHDIEHWWDVAYNDVIKYVVHYVEDYCKPLFVMFEWYIDVGIDAVKLVVKAEPWLVMLAEHPEATVLKAFHDAFNVANVEWMIAQTNMVEGYVDTWATELDNLLK